MLLTEIKHVLWRVRQAGNLVSVRLSSEDSTLVLQMDVGDHTHVGRVEGLTHPIQAEVAFEPFYDWITEASLRADDFAAVTMVRADQLEVQAGQFRRSFPLLSEGPSRPVADAFIQGRGSTVSREVLSMAVCPGQVMQVVGLDTTLEWRLDSNAFTACTRIKTSTVGRGLGTLDPLGTMLLSRMYAPRDVRVYIEGRRLAITHANVTLVLRLQ